MDYLNSLKQLTENFLSDYFDKDKEEDKKSVASAAKEAEEKKKKKPLKQY